ncbi:MAG: hypothetical protein H0X51_02350 [Parachlamydiaceae bacterium]|nr:hypothetical protein [Parachlamydiaceae bacterium]
MNGTGGSFNQSPDLTNITSTDADASVKYDKELGNFVLPGGKRIVASEYTTQGGSTWQEGAELSPDRIQEMCNLLARSIDSDSKTQSVSATTTWSECTITENPQTMEQTTTFKWSDGKEHTATYSGGVAKNVDKMVSQLLPSAQGASASSSSASESKRMAEVPSQQTSTSQVQAPLASLPPQSQNSSTKSPPPPPSTLRPPPPPRPKQEIDERTPLLQQEAASNQPRLDVSLIEIEAPSAWKRLKYAVTDAWRRFSPPAKSTHTTHLRGPSLQTAPQVQSSKPENRLVATAETSLLGSEVKEKASERSPPQQTMGDEEDRENIRKLAFMKPEPSSKKELEEIQEGQSKFFTKLKNKISNFFTGKSKLEVIDDRRRLVMSKQYILGSQLTSINQNFHHVMKSLPEKEHHQFMENHLKSWALIRAELNEYDNELTTLVVKSKEIQGFTIRGFDLSGYHDATDVDKMKAELRTSLVAAYPSANEPPALPEVTATVVEQMESKQGAASSKTHTVTAAPSTRGRGWTVAKAKMKELTEAQKRSNREAATIPKLFKEGIIEEHQVENVEAMRKLMKHALNSTPPHPQVVTQLLLHLVNLKGETSPQEYQQYRDLLANAVASYIDTALTRSSEGARQAELQTLLNYAFNPKEKYEDIVKRPPLEMLAQMELMHAVKRALVREGGSNANESADKIFKNIDKEPLLQIHQEQQDNPITDLAAPRDIARDNRSLYAAVKSKCMNSALGVVREAAFINFKLD